MSKRKADDEQLSLHRVDRVSNGDLERFVCDFVIVRPTPTFRFFENNYLRGLYELFHTNCLYRWLRRDFGEVDEPVIQRDVLENIWTDLNIL